MRIAVVVDRLNRSLGGREQYLWSLLRGLVSLEHRICVLSCECPVVPENVDIQIFPSGFIPAFLREWNFCRNADLILKKFEPDSVLSLHPLSSATHYPLRSGLLCDAFKAERESLKPGIRYHLYPLGQVLNLRRQIAIRRERQFLCADRGLRTLANSKLVKERLMTRFSIDPDTVQVTYTGIDLDLFRPLELDQRFRKREADLKLLFVGHNFLLKGLPCLFQALKSELLDGLNIQLTVVGNGPVRKFRRLVHRLGLTSRVSFTQTDSRVEVVRIYQGHDAMVLPTFNDPCSLACLEALACGLPVITTSRNGAAELLRPGFNGFVINHPRNVPKLAEAIRTLFDETTRREMSINARKTALNLDLEQHVKKVASWLES